jgi:hypothetical protein
VVNPLGFYRTQVRRGDKSPRVYQITRAAMKDLFERYGVHDEA